MFGGDSDMPLVAPSEYSSQFGQCFFGFLVCTAMFFQSFFKLVVGGLNFSETA